MLTYLVRALQLQERKSLIMAYRPQAVTIDCTMNHLVEFCRTNYLTKLFLVANKNTFAAQGKAAQRRCCHGPGST